MSDIDAQLRDSFDPIAALYDRARPGYPEAVFDEIIAFAELGAGSRVLELGAGSGKATLQFARRGFGVVGLEPGKHLAQIARARLAIAEIVRGHGDRVTLDYRTGLFLARAM